MAKLFQIPCMLKRGNTGMPSTCTFDPDLFIGALAMPKGTVLTAAQLADIQTVLQAAFINNTYGSRFHLFGKFETPEDQSEERQQQTFATGRKKTVREATYYWRFQYIDGAMCKLLAYQQFNDREDEFDYLFIDKSRNMIGTRALDADDKLGFGGVAVSEFRAENWKMNTGSEVTGYFQSIGIEDASDLNANLAYINLDFDIFALDQVQDGTMNLLTDPSGTGVFNVDILSGCGNDNLVNLYETDLAATGNFTLSNTQTGAGITISSISVGGLSPNKWMVVDADHTDGDYPASGEYMTLTPDGVADIFTATGGYYDIQPINILIP